MSGILLILFLMGMESFKSILFLQVAAKLLVVMATVVVKLLVFNITSEIDKKDKWDRVNYKTSQRFQSYKDSAIFLFFFFFSFLFLFN